MSFNRRVAAFQTLVAAKHTVITRASNAAWNQVRGAGEINRLREFLIGANKGIHFLNRRLPRHFSPSGFQLKLAAILVHAKPIVQPLSNYKQARAKKGLPANPELGDLNLVFLFLDQQKNVRAARSIIYQAKTHRASDSEAISEAHQRYLYDSAKGFKYTNGPYQDKKRQLPICTKRRRGMHYLFVSEIPVNMSPTPSADPAFMPWGESFYRLLLDADGIGLPSGKAKGSGWSKINEDLVTIFKNDAQLKANNLSELASWFNDFSDPDHWFAKASENSVGIDTLLVIIRDKELPPAKIDGPPTKAQIDKLNRRRARRIELNGGGSK